MPDPTIELAYDPLLLPTAQHRGGLAGLLVLRDSLAQRQEEDGREIGPLPTSVVDGDGVVRLTFSKASLQTLFDDLFAAAWDPRTSKTAPKGTGFRDLEPFTVEPPDGKGKPTQQFRYTVIVPKAEFLTTLGMPDIWRKLWRDAIWATLRGRPKSRIPYEQSSTGKPVDQAGKLWAELTNKKLGPERPTAFSESLLIGAQSETADSVPFEGTARETLLLYFWPVVSLVGQVRQIKTERKEGHTRTLEDDAGYVFTVPDVANVAPFVRRFRRAVAQLDASARGNDYRPAHGIWALPQEGALEFQHHIVQLAASAAEQQEARTSMTGVEIYQLMKRGNNVPIVATGRVSTSSWLADRYALIRDRKTSWSPIFRAQTIRNLLREYAHGDVPWYRDFDKVFERHDWELFAGDAAGPFAHDARLAFGE